MSNNGEFCPIMSHNGESQFQHVVILYSKTEAIGTPKEILDTPKEILDTPKENPITPKVTTVLNIKRLKIKH